MPAPSSEIRSRAGKSTTSNEESCPTNTSSTQKKQRASNASSGSNCGLVAAAFVFAVVGVVVIARVGMREPVRNYKLEFKDCMVNRAGLRLYKRVWQPEGTPKGIYILVHGFGEYCHRPGWLKVANGLTQNGFVVYAIDHQGHGLSQGERANIGDMQQYVDDMVQLSLLAQREHQNIPLFVYGHSMGSVIAMDLALQASFVSGLVLSGTALFVDPKLLTPTIKFLAHTLAYVLPSLSLDKINTSYLSRNETAVAQYISDPLMHSGGAKAAFASTYIKTVERLTTACAGLKMPLLILHGEADLLTLPQGSQLVYEKAQSKDKALKLYPGVFHELYEDPDTDTILSDLMSWAALHADGNEHPISA